MNRSLVLQLSYAALAVLGVVLPWFYNLQYIAANPGPFSPAQFVSQAMTTPAASSLTVDIGIVFLAAAVFMFVEAKRLAMRLGPLNLAIPLIIYSLCIAVASGLPLFLLLRERRLQRKKTNLEDSS